VVLLQTIRIANPRSNDDYFLVQFSLFFAISKVNTAIILKIGLMGPRKRPAKPETQSPLSQPPANGIKDESAEKAKS
jgi:hypothetical protein